MQPGQPVNEEERLEKLPQDYDTPFSPPSGVQDTTDDTHPQADTNVDAHEHYDEGISGADEVIDRRGRGILAYHQIHRPIREED